MKVSFEDVQLNIFSKIVSFLSSMHQISAGDWIDKDVIFEELSFQPKPHNEGCSKQFFSGTICISESAPSAKEIYDGLGGIIFGKK